MLTYKVEVDIDGAKFWYFKGKVHRENGPSIEYPDGTKIWYRDGKLHREDGPAIEFSNGIKSWYLNGKLLSEEDFAQKMKPVKELSIQEISNLLGYEIKIVKG